MSDSSNSTDCVMSNSGQVMSDSSNSTDCVMSNSSYSSDGVVNKSKEEVAVFVVEFESIFRKFVHDVISKLFQGFFISEQVMSDSSNSTDCVMSNSGYSSDGVVNKSKDEIVFDFAIFSFSNVFSDLFSQHL